MVETRHRIAARTVGELHRPTNRLFHFIKEFRFGLRLLVGCNRDRSDAIGCHASSMNNVDAEVHHRATARQFLVNAPGALAEDEAAVSRHFHEWAKILVAGQSHQLAMIEVVMQTVSDRELHLRSLACSNHAVAIGDGGRHRLL